MTHHEILEQIVNNIKQYYACKFVSDKKRFNVNNYTFYYETENANKKLILGFNGWHRLILSRNTYNQYKHLIAGEPVIITSEGIRFIQRPEIVTHPSPSSTIWVEDKTIDVYCKDYKGTECYFNLCIKYPNVSENILRTIEYFCLNPVPKGVYLELDSSALRDILTCTFLIKNKIQCKK